MIDLDDLRVKLGKDTREFLYTELAIGFTLAEVAETESDLGHSEAATRSLAHGEEGYATLHRFLQDPKHAGYLTGDQLQELSTGLERLRQKLDEVGRLHTQR
jgi:hypothetical protein